MSDVLQPSFAQIIANACTTANEAIRGEASPDSFPQSGPGPCAERALADFSLVQDELDLLFEKAREELDAGETYGIHEHALRRVRSTILNASDSDSASKKAALLSFLTEATGVAMRAARKSAEQ